MDCLDLVFAIYVFVALCLNVDFDVFCLDFLWFGFDCSLDCVWFMLVWFDWFVSYFGNLDCLNVGIWVFVILDLGYCLVVRYCWVCYLVVVTCLFLGFVSMDLNSVSCLCWGYCQVCFVTVVVYLVCFGCWHNVWVLLFMVWVLFAFVLRCSGLFRTLIGFGLVCFACSSLW